MLGTESRKVDQKVESSSFYEMSFKSHASTIKSCDAFCSVIHVGSLSSELYCCGWSYFEIKTSVLLQDKSFMLITLFVLFYYIH